jgi:hypothetical protein
LLVPVLLLVAWVAVVMAEVPVHASLPADVQARLGQYIGHVSGPATPSLRWVERAKRPWRFTRAMSDSVFGNGVHFQADEGPSGTLPLPFPPEELWCVLLDRASDPAEDPAGPSYSMVFVGLHMSMYEADWLVHESAADTFSPEFRQSLSQVGCDLVLD